MKKEASTIADGDGSKEDDDRISSLPDEILHEILERLRSHKQSGKVSLLSKRWNHLWLSYPILEFDCSDYADAEPSRSTMNSFIAAAKRKLSYSALNSYIKSLRIVSFDSAFIEAALDLIRDKELEEIDMIVDSASVNLTQFASVNLTQLLLNSAKLKALKLDGGKLLEGPSPTINHHYMKMINLRVFHLCDLNIDNRVLNSMIAAAPLLENLTLMAMYTVKKVEVCNNANLKHLQISYMKRLSEIAGDLHSLETLSLSWLDCRDLEIICSSLLPSLKSLEIKHCPKLRSFAVNKLISKSPSLLSLHLVCVNEAKELKIKSPILEKLELEWYHWHSKSVLHIDAPSLVNVSFGGDIGSLHVISDATNSFQAAQIRSSTFELSLVCRDMEYQNFKELKEFLKKVTRQFQCVELQLIELTSSLSKPKDWDWDSPTPFVEFVELKPHGRWERFDQTFLYKILWSCHPKYFSLRRDTYTNKLPSLELINEVFMERTPPNCKKIECKCWRHQLKDVKIVNTRDKDKEELVDISADALSAFPWKNHVLFKLIWY